MGLLPTDALLGLTPAISVVLYRVGDIRYPAAVQLTEKYSKTLVEMVGVTLGLWARWSWAM